MYDAFTVKGKKLEPDRARTVCTCGEVKAFYFINFFLLIFGDGNWWQTEA